MSKTVVVSSAQKSAARAMVRRSAATGRYVSKSVHRIANAKTQLARDSETSPKR